MTRIETLPSFYLLNNINLHEKKSHSTCCLVKLVKSIFENIKKLFKCIFCCTNKPLSKKKYLDRKIKSKKLTHTWKRVIPEKRGESSFSHLRAVYIGPKGPLGDKSVVKISSRFDRKRKGSNNAWPSAEEIAYVASKRLGWNVVPKTKVLHGSDLKEISKNPAHKHYKYACIQRSMTKSSESKEKIDKYTFTFQKYIEGKTLPKEGRDQKINNTSFQRAFLLDTILGKGDARRDNVMYNPKTRELIEIDNESLALKGYSPKGVLRDYSQHMKNTIPATILDEVLAFSTDDISEIQQKYTRCDNHILACWRNEDPSSVRKTSEELKHHWTSIKNNLTALQRSIQKLRNKPEPITLKELEKVYNQIRITL